MNVLRKLKFNKKQIYYFISFIITFHIIEYRHFEEWNYAIKSQNVEKMICL